MAYGTKKREKKQGVALPQKKSNRKREIPQNKNLTQICLSEGGFGGRNGVIYARKKALTREVSKRYQQAGKKEKTKILDELVKTTGYNRKYAPHILANWGKTATVCLPGKAVRLKAAPRKRKKGGGRKPVYY